MKKQFIPFSVLIVVIVGFAIGMASRGPKHPHIFFDKEVIDAGKVAQGSKKELALTIENRGKAKLVIEAIKMSCSCSSTSLSTDRIAPGESALLTFFVTSKRRFGSSKESFQIVSNDPVNPKKVVYIAVTHDDPLLDVSPSTVDFGEIRRGKLLVKSVYLRNRGRAHFDPATVKPPEELKLTARPAEKRFYEMPSNPNNNDADDEQYVLDLQLDAKDLPLGPYKALVWLDDEETAAIGVRARVVGEIEVEPQSLYYGAVSRGDRLERSVTLSSRENEPFRILSVDSQNMPVKVTFSAADSPQTAYRFQARLDESIILEPKQKKVHGSVVVTTDLQSQPKVEIPLFALLHDTR